MNLNANNKIIMLPLFVSSFLWMQSSLLIGAYTPQSSRKGGAFGLGYQSPRESGELMPPMIRSPAAPPVVVDSAAVAVEDAAMAALLQQQRQQQQQPSNPSLQTLPTLDMSQIKFTPSKVYQELFQATGPVPRTAQGVGTEQFYPFALMLQASAPYIAAHAGQIAVFHIPGEYIVNGENNNNNNHAHETSPSNLLFSDIALAHLLGIKIVIVVGNRYDMDECDFDLERHPHECHNALKVTDDAAMRRVEEEAGYLRVEVERKLNRYLRLNGMVSSAESNVVSGNFYHARKYGNLQGEEFEHSGFTSGVNVVGIQHHLDNDDVVLLTTVGVTQLGELVNVNGYHLTASVAAALQAYKVIYFSNQGTVLTNQETLLQEVPLSFAQALTDYHEVNVHNTGFATFEGARHTHDAGALEILLHLSWASWALERGVKRAHIVNPGDGAILEELFTSKNGANTCLYHDSELQAKDDTGADGFENDWDDFLVTPLAPHVKKHHKF